tara:strand:+ start:230 stop:2296 length:2067 start_codon:yes stop_codon:yes gene_type:complete
MNNSIHFIDSIQYSCVVDKDNIMLSNSLGNSLKVSDNNKLVSYMIKGSNSKNTVWEMGVGTIITDKGLMVSRDRLISSSNGKSLNFKGYDCTFYIIPNAQNYNTGFNNVIVHEDSFSIDPVSSIHILDSDNEAVNISLPSASTSENVVIEIKNIQDSCVAYIIEDSNIVDFLSGDKSYTKIVSDGNQWRVLVDSSMSQQDTDVSVLSDSVGSAGSLQYSDGATSFLASDVYYDATKDNLLLGNSNESNAYSIISTTGNDTVFNQTYSNANFIVYGSGKKNIYWHGGEGRFGINIPPGSQPSSPLHLINLENCEAGIRVENRNSNTTANLSLYHRPSLLPSTGTICNTINFNARDNTSSSTQLAQIKSVVLDNIQPSTSGQLVFSVGKSGTLIDRVSLQHDAFDVSLDDTSFIMSNTGVFINSPMVNITGSVTMPNLIMDAGVISFTGVPSDCVHEYGPAPSLTPTPTPTPTPINYCPVDDGSGSGSGSGSGDSCELNTIVASLYLDANGKEYLQIHGAMPIGKATPAKRTVYVQSGISPTDLDTDTTDVFPLIYTTSPLQVKVQPYIVSEPFAISGNYPLYTTEAGAAGHNNVDNNNSILPHVHYGSTYYMPDVGDKYIGTYTEGNVSVPDITKFSLNNQHHVLVNGKRIHQYVGDDNTGNSTFGYSANFATITWVTLNSDGNHETNT